MQREKETKSKLYTCIACWCGMCKQGSDRSCVIPHLGYLVLEALTDYQHHNSTGILIIPPAYSCEKQKKEEGFQQCRNIFRSQSAG